MEAQGMVLQGGGGNQYSVTKKKASISLVTESSPEVVKARTMALSCSNKEDREGR